MPENPTQKIKAWLKDDLPWLLTEPMSCVKLAEIFKVDRTTMRAAIEHMEGKERFGKTKFRIPLHAMPAGWLLSCGLIEPFKISDEI
jgi:hypothetical protein